VLALAVAAYVLVRNDAYLRLDAALQVATGATTMSAEHELGEHVTKLGGEKDLQLVLEEGGSSALADTQILVREGRRNAAFKPGIPQSFDLRTIPPEKLTNGATFSGFRIAARNFRVQKSILCIKSMRPNRLLPPWRRSRASALACWFSFRSGSASLDLRDIS